MRQGTKGNMDLGPSVQFCGVISDRNGRPETIKRERAENDTESYVYWTVHHLTS